MPFSSYVSCLGKVLRNWGNCGYKEGSSGQKVQEPWAANYAASWPSKCCCIKALLLLNHREGWTVSQPCPWVCPRNSSQGDKALQQIKPKDAADLCKTLHVPGIVIKNIYYRNLILATWLMILMDYFRLDNEWWWCYSLEMYVS